MTRRSNGRALVHRSLDRAKLKLPKRNEICASGKRRYITEAQAHLALLRVQNMRSEQESERSERRVYWHSTCRGYHLTSRDEKGER